MEKHRLVLLLLTLTITACNSGKQSQQESLKSASIIGIWGLEKSNVKEAPVQIVFSSDKVFFIFFPGNTLGI